MTKGKSKASASYKRHRSKKKKETPYQAACRKAAAMPRKHRKMIRKKNRAPESRTVM